MKDKIQIKIAFDVLLAFLWIALMLYALTGSFLHEWAGLISLGLILVHLIVNANWIIQTTKRIFTSTFSKTKCKYILNIGLLILTVFTGISGILISKEIFTWIDVGNREVLVFLHHLSAYLTMIGISIHIGLHWDMMLFVFKKWFHIEKPSMIRNLVCKMLALGVIIWGLGAQLFYEITLPSGTSSSKTTKKEETTSTQASDSDVATVEEYLGNLYCDGCHKHCSLLSPRCGVGENQAEEATNDYEAMYTNQVSDMTVSYTSSLETIDTSTDVASENTLAIAESQSDTLIDKLTDGDISGAKGLCEVLPIMGFYIAGTHYTVKLIEARKKSKRLQS